MSKKLRKEIGNDKIYNLVKSFQDCKTATGDYDTNGSYFKCDDFRFVYSRKLGVMSLKLEDDSKLNESDYYWYASEPKVKGFLWWKKEEEFESKQYLLTTYEFQELNIWLSSRVVRKAKNT